MSYKNDDIRINHIEELLPPVALLERFPASDIAAQTVANTRQAVHNILHGKDDRLLVVIGPCSIHDPIAALEYAKRIQSVRENPEINQYLEVVMRVYFEKPRTTVGWKGLINDPYLNETFALNDGLRIARKVLSDINDLTVPTAGEFLDMITPQYLADFMSWGAIGARTTESQVHRELASGLSCAVGFKNATNGSVKIALDAIGAAEAPHHFLSVTKFGHSAIVSTKGNPDCHIILRGGDSATNYDAQSVAKVCADIEQSGRRPHVMIDFSHANSQKQFKRQLTVCDDVCQQIASGSHFISGVMIESHLVEGRQDLVDGKALTYGQSITDACIGWEDSQKVLFQLANAVKQRRQI
ncbi:MAG: 3-deoxy-7-phosphoheptulonate synthase AroG [Pasteurellaceae bacterium]|nr:3-deoxy-7-phosphoheptulonate synthase AroG [Pasteurellaceae bacterium]